MRIVGNLQQSNWIVSGQVPNCYTTIACAPFGKYKWQWIGSPAAATNLPSGERATDSMASQGPDSVTSR